MKNAVQLINKFYSACSSLARSGWPRGFFLLLPAGSLVLVAGAVPKAPGPAKFGILFFVDSGGDEPDTFPGDHQCLTALGTCTLRAAIQETNARQNGGDSIDVGVPLVTLTQALPNITTAVTIFGSGPDQTTVQRSIDSANFTVFYVTTSGTVSFSGLTISNGHTCCNGGGILNSTGTVNITNCTLNGNFSDVEGGGISNGATVNVTNSTISGNFAYKIQNFGGFGGGIENGGTLTVTNSTISGNFADTTGGGILNEGTGTVNITNSTLSGNSAYNGFGGGINNGGGTVKITSSTLNGNYAFAAGGGISIPYGATVNVTNSTISGNRATNFQTGGSGGGIENGGTLTVTNSTLSGNFADTTGGISNSGTANVKSTIVALNTAGSSGPDVGGSFASQGFNLIGKTDGSTGFTAATDQTGTIAAPLDPKLDPNDLQDNGGPTLTIALLTGSPAIDKATSNGLTGALTTDQRGVGYSRTIAKGIVSGTRRGRRESRHDYQGDDDRRQCDEKRQNCCLFELS